MNTWRIYQGSDEPHDGISKLPEPPPWRAFTGTIKRPPVLDEYDSYAERMLARGQAFRVTEDEIELVNAALYLRRPLLISGRPGNGKSSLAYAVARELKLGPVLRWSVTSRTTLGSGLYTYDAIARLQATGTGGTEDAETIGQYIHLGPLGAALLPSDKPRVLLIDEIDKSDIDLPNDLLHIFEEGEFAIPELVRIAQQQPEVEVYYESNSAARVTIEKGIVRCRAFPFVVLTSNEEREFPPAFLRRCLRLNMKPPTREKLEEIVKAHLGAEVFPAANLLIDDFFEQSQHQKGYLATDQLLNAVYLATRGIDDRDRGTVFSAVWQQLHN